MANRLAHASSPYLLQHADNPVDWHPWGPEAFAQAKQLGKPVFVSIGYAACHWCHVMAHESFEDPRIAALMNELFISIKVDREEHPEVDALYMNAIQVMGEGGGWPLSAFCLSDGTPYFLGTYFPPEDRYGRPGFAKALKEMARVFHEESVAVKENTQALLDGLQRLDSFFRHAKDTALGGLSTEILVTAGRQLAGQSDKANGGLGEAPKFPSTPVHELLARCARLAFGQDAKEAFVLQAQKMADGGIYDHLGGGFARYAVDSIWLVPHFEKMLYDNAQLLAVYAEAYAMTQNGRFSQVIDETVSWLEREMSDNAGGLYASMDADSEGEEGLFYTWTTDEISDVLGSKVDALQFCAAYGVTARGNFEGRNVLSRTAKISSDYEDTSLRQMKQKLFDAREKRVRPDTDTKVLTAWNALAISGLVRAWKRTGSTSALALAERVAGFLTKTMIDGEKVLRVYRDGTVYHEGTLADYAFTARALLELAEASNHREYWQLAETLTASLLEKFWDSSGVFYMSTTQDAELLAHRPESNQDGALPSGASAAIECMVRVGQMADKSEWLSRADKYLRSRLPGAEGAAFSSAGLLRALDWHLNGAQLVITDGEGKNELLKVARAAFAPSLAIAGSFAAPSVLEGKEADEEGRAQAYLCRGQSCMPPVATADELEHLIANAQSQ